MNRTHQVGHQCVPKTQKPSTTHGLENDIGLGSELLQRHNVVKGPKDSLEPQFLKALGLFGRAKVNCDIVVGLFGVSDKVGEDGSPDVTWSIAIPTDHQRCQCPIKHREECYGLHTCSTDKKNTRHGLPGAQRWGVVVWSASRSSGGLCLGLSTYMWSHPVVPLLSSGVG